MDDMSNYQFGSTPFFRRLALISPKLFQSSDLTFSFEVQNPLDRNSWQSSQILLGILYNESDLTWTMFQVDFLW